MHELYQKLKKELEEHWGTKDIEFLKKESERWLMKSRDWPSGDLILHNPPLRVTKEWLDDYIQKREK